MTILAKTSCALRDSLISRRGRIEWLGVLLALPFAIAAVKMGLDVISSKEITIRTAHMAAGTLFAGGLALGIYSSAWAFAARELHQRLTAYSAVLDAMALMTFAIAIERFFYTMPKKTQLLCLLVIPVGLWLAATIILIPATMARKRALAAKEKDDTDTVDSEQQEPEDPAANGN